MKEEDILEMMSSLGFNVKGKTFLRNVELLINEHIRVLKELDIESEEHFKKELERVTKNPTN